MSTNAENLKSQVLVLIWLGWWREAGFNEPSRWRNLHLLWFPLLVGVGS